MSTAVSTSKRPYFFWDYDITDDEIRAILRAANRSTRPGLSVAFWNTPAGMI